MPFCIQLILLDLGPSPCPSNGMSDVEGAVQLLGWAAQELLLCCCVELWCNYHQSGARIHKLSVCASHIPKFRLH